MQLLISAGPTREAIDAVRFLSNRSTGKMGYALARQALVRGHRVILVSGPVALEAPAGVTLVPVESARQMAEAVTSRAAECDLVIMTAAVADYRPKQTISGKLKKQAGDLVLELERTEDILAGLGAVKPAGQCLVGFAAETEALERYALDKLQRKNLDWIVANDVSRSDRGFGAENNSVVMFARDGRRVEIPLASKDDVARRILEEIGA